MLQRLVRQIDYLPNFGVLSLNEHCFGSRLKTKKFKRPCCRITILAFMALGQCIPRVQELIEQDEEDKHEEKEAGTGSGMKMTRQAQDLSDRWILDDKHERQA